MYAGEKKIQFSSSQPCGMIILCIHKAACTSPTTVGKGIDSISVELLERSLCK